MRKNESIHSALQFSLPEGEVGEKKKGKRVLRVLCNEGVGVRTTASSRRERREEEREERGKVVVVVPPIRTELPQKKKGEGRAR